MRRTLTLSTALLAAFGLAIFLAAGTAGAQAEAPVKIGLMGPITGQWASEGQDMLNVVNILAGELNAQGGINGRQVEIVVGDDGGNPKTAALAAQRLIAEGVSAVVGTYGSSVTASVQDIYDEAGVVQVATGSTSVVLSEKGLRLFFRTCPRDDEQGRFLASSVKNLGFTRAAIVHDNTSYAKGLADEARSIFRDSGVSEVFFDAITPGDRDYNATLTKIRAAAPDVIVFTGYYPEAGLILRQKKEMNWDVPMIGGDATNNVALVEGAGSEAAAGYYFVSPPGPSDIKGEKAQKLLGTYRARHDALPSSVWSILAGDAFGVIAEAVKASGTEGLAIAEYLHTGLKGYDGLTGPISFNEKGDRIGDVYSLYQVQPDGSFMLK
ncbi:MAG: branched-chain amino acid ABC transporter substrate-binding protein [Deltaproteobacteria bacterium]|jgi:branched-chain amino acid transport system substrate-binding protein|nr:branched-chain amino acid ABC transporter substrate-binding protein [Deltaproteobacteria bacterium]